MCKFQKYADEGNGRKDLWPMTKTHKSLEIARLQLEFGATGFLCGTLDECELLIKSDEIIKHPKIKGIMYAYPVAGTQNVSRVL